MKPSNANSRETRRRRSNHRADHRRRNHRAAAGETTPPPKVPDHPLIPAREPRLITDADDLAELIDHARSVGRCAYDTEFIGETSYFPRLCLIQISTTDRVAVIDAMAGLELEPVWRLLADPAVQKIVHAGGQDLEPVARHINQPAANVFDTQIAAGFIGLPYPLALTRLVEELLGIRLGKALTFTSWDERPLPPAHLRYAADDVRYLPALHETMSDRLHRLGHADFALRECGTLCEEAARPFDAEEQVRRMRPSRSLSGRKRAVLRELVALRDEGAREHDVPPRTFLKDQVLMDLTRRMVKSVEDLKKVRGLPRPVEQSHGRRIVEATQRALDQPVEQRSAAENIEESASQRFRIDGLWAAAQAYCLGRGIDPALVASRQTVIDYYRSVTMNRSDGPPRVTRGWRGELLGRFLNDFMAGRQELSVKWSDEGLQSKTNDGSER